MFKSLISFSLLTSLSICSAIGQEVFKGNSFGGGFNFTVGYLGYNGDQFYPSDKPGFISPAYDVRTSGGNVVESASLFNKPSNSLLTMGFQGFGVFNSVIVGGELNAGFGSQEKGTQTDEITPITGGQASTLISQTSSRFIQTDVMLNVGYVAFRKRGFIAYPMLGLGYGASGIWLKSESNERAYPFIAKVVTDDDGNLQNIFVYSKNLVVDLGLGAQYMFGASTEDRAKGFSLGFRIGYKFQPETDNITINWNKNAKDSFPGDADLPKVGMSSFYAKLLIGFGKVGDNR